jgi:hypothetical protein
LFFVIIARAFTEADEPASELLARFTRQGNTVELHVWYEQHQFPDRSGVQFNESSVLPDGAPLPAIPPESI